VRINWRAFADDAVNPYSGEADIIGYRVYRSSWLNWGPWELHDTIPKGASGKSVNGDWKLNSGWYQYEDLDTAAGFPYHYSIRPYAKGYSTWSGGGKTLDDIPVGRVKANVAKGYESGWGPSTARTYDADERKPFQPVTDETNRLEKKVLVVPNPYRIDGKHQYPNSPDIRFVGIPESCLIYVFTAAGDRVRTIEHNSTTSGEDFWNQVTYNVAGQVQTGLYYFVVVSQTPGSEGKTQTGSFVLIK
jgi:hypothetical protein